MPRPKRQPERRRSRGAPKPFPVRRNGVIERYAVDVELPKMPGGSRKRERVYGKTEAECLQNARKLLTARTDGEQRITNTPTLRTYGDWWLETVKAPTVTPQTLENYRGHFTKHIYPALGEKPLTAITTEQLQTVITRIHAVAPGTTKEVATHLHSLFAYAVAARPQRRKDNPMDGVRVPRHTPRQGRPLTPDELHRLAAALTGHRYEGAYWLAICGLRAGEVCGAQWGDVHGLDADAPYIDVRRQAVRTKAGLKLTEKLKTDKSRRRVYLLPQAVAALKAQRARDAAAQLASGKRTAQIAPAARAALLDPGTLWRCFKAVLAAAGLPAAAIRLHDLRGSYATIAHGAGAAMRDVQAQLGHATPATTMRYYTQPTDEGQQDVARRVGERLKETGS